MTIGYLTTLFMLCLLLTSPVRGQKAERWPHIRAFDKVFTFSGDNMHLTVPILDERGRHVYTVECASVQHLIEDKVTDFEWSADFECRVFVPGARFMPDVQLLAVSSRPDTRVYESRGRFFWNQLSPDCITYPDWGGVREFRFRNMRLTIHISDVQMTPPAAEPLTLIIVVHGLRVEIRGRYDPKAFRAVAGPALVQQPPPLHSTWPSGPLQCGPPHK